MKLLVTTDFSTNSKGAIRFAQTLAKQSKDIEVVFYHGVQFMRPTLWSDDFYMNYEKVEKERLLIQLKSFVNKVIGKERKKSSNIKFVIDSVISLEKDIIKYAEKNKADYICIATQGAGILRKIMGTHTSHIVNNSKIPVLVIPSHYRSKPLKKTTYLSDFENLKEELNTITTLTNTIKSSLDVLHYTSIVFDNNKFQKNLALFKTDNFKSIKLNIVKSDYELSLVERVSRYVAKSKPELLIMFTNKKKSFFETIFLPSKSAELTYTTKVPVLIFSK